MAMRLVVLLLFFLLPTFLPRPALCAEKTVFPTPPASRAYMEPPQRQLFALYRSKAGYQLLLSGEFGGDPLASLPDSKLYNGTMLLRKQSEQLLLALTLLDPLDSEAYKSIAPLPLPAGSRFIASWLHSSFLTWLCRLYRQNDLYGEKFIMEATAPFEGKTYQALFVFPAARFGHFLPQALYSLNSFKVLQKAP